MITKDEYNTINQYNELLNKYRYTGELIISYDVKEVLKPIYHKYSGTILNAGCGNCVKKMIDYLIKLIDEYNNNK